MLMESCSHKETMFLEKSKSCGGPISIHKWEQRKNSVDLDVGRRPELKSEEFSFVPIYLPRYQGVKTYSQQNK